VGTAIIGLYKIYHWWFYRSRPWRRIHYPVMRTYAAILGAAKGEEESEGKQFNLYEALSELVSAHVPNMSHEDIRKFLDREFERCRTFADIDLVESHMRKEMPHLDNKLIRETLEKYRPYLNPNDRFTMAKMVIAGLIERGYSEKDRGEYMYEVLTNNAK